MKSSSLICIQIFLVTLTAISAKISIEPRIIRGQDAEDGQFPYAVSLRYRAFSVHFCGASILSERFLLTAAHCLKRKTPENIFAVVGALRVSSGGVNVELDTITSHVNYREGSHDIAVIRTATKITFTKYIQPIALPTTNLPDDKSVRVLACGWGQSRVGYLLINQIEN